MSSKRFTPATRSLIAGMTIFELANYCRNIGLQPLGANANFMLTEIARHLGMPTDAVSINIIRQNKGKDEQGYTVWHWGFYSEHRIERFRKTDGRKWNSTCHCNTFSIPEINDPDFLGMLGELFSRSILIDENDFLIQESDTEAEWMGNVLYDLSDKPYTVNLGHVLESFWQLRPEDRPSYLSLHGEIDPKFRTMFKRGVKIDDYREYLLTDIEFETKHKLLLFRFSMPHGKLRYLIFSAEENKSLEILFAGSRESKRAMMVFKETQQRLAHPLIEPSAALEEKLREHDAETDAADDNAEKETIH